MAKSKASTSSILREIYTAEPSLLDSATNDEVLQRYREKTGGRVTDSVKAINYNLRSLLRKEAGGQTSTDKPKRKPGRRKAAVITAPAIAKTPVSAPARSLEQLEEQIDDCLGMAKEIEGAGLENVIQQLRQARNVVIRQVGGR